MNLMAAAICLFRVDALELVAHQLAIGLRQHVLHDEKALFVELLLLCIGQGVGRDA
jgi:hypothetical protein